MFSKDIIISSQKLKRARKYFPRAYKMKDLNFFLGRIDKVITEGNAELGECWIWNMAYDGKGRPVYTDRSEESKNKNASREIYKLVKMPTLPAGRQHPVLHRCKNQYGCINPDHLYYVEEGGAKQNRTDAVNQQQIGPRKLKNKLDEIVKLFKEGVEQKEIAIRLGVSRMTIQRFLNGQMNQHTHNYIKEAEDIRNSLIQKLFEEGNSLTQIMNKANCAQSVIFAIVPEIRTRPKGTETKESKAIKSSLTIEERNKEIKRLRAEGKPVKELANQFAVSVPLIYNILKQA